MNWTPESSDKDVFSKVKHEPRLLGQAENEALPR